MELSLLKKEQEEGRRRRETEVAEKQSDTRTLSNCSHDRECSFHSPRGGKPLEEFESRKRASRPPRRGQTVEEQDQKDTN